MVFPHLSDTKPPPMAAPQPHRWALRTAAMRPLPPEDGLHGSPHGFVERNPLGYMEVSYRYPIDGWFSRGKIPKRKWIICGVPPF